MRSPSAGGAGAPFSARFRAERHPEAPDDVFPFEGLRMGRDAAGQDVMDQNETDQSEMDRDSAHTPVLTEMVVSILSVVPSGLVVDGTVGFGGHAAALLDALPRVGVLGLDRDPQAVTAAARRVAGYGARAAVRHARFGDLQAEVAAAQERGAVVPATPVVGVLLDLGVSSAQLDRAERGFSFRSAGPLDMRMDPTGGMSASELVNGASEEALRRLFVEHGEGRLAGRLARAIVRARPLETTAQLADVVEAAVPAAQRRRGHPATRVFQALRVTVNEEMEELARVLPAALELLTPGGRCVVLAYHSGEDRLVKAAFASAARGGCTCPPGLPCVCGAVPTHRLVFSGARKPSQVEIQRNRRAASARLRAVERLDPSAAAVAEVRR